jgi:hypothetical protein
MRTASSARAATGHAAALPSPAMNFRRLITGSPHLSSPLRRMLHDEDTSKRNFWLLQPGARGMPASGHSRRLARPRWRHRSRSGHAARRARPHATAPRGERTAQRPIPDAADAPVSRAGACRADTIASEHPSGPYPKLAPLRRGFFIASSTRRIGLLPATHPLTRDGPPGHPDWQKWVALTYISTCRPTVQVDRSIRWRQR